MWPLHLRDMMEDERNLGILKGTGKARQNSATCFSGIGQTHTESER